MMLTRPITVPKKTGHAMRQSGAVKCKAAQAERKRAKAPGHLTSSDLINVDTIWGACVSQRRCIAARARQMCRPDKNCVGKGRP